MFESGQGFRSSRWVQGWRRLRRVLAGASAGIAVVACAAPSQAALNPLASRMNTAKALWKVATDAATVRHECETLIENGTLAWTVDCSEDPVALGGAGTGDAAIDEALQTALTSRSGSYLNLRLNGTPEDHGVDALCSPRSNDWAEIDVCFYQLALADSKELLALTFFDEERVVSSDEIACRRALGNRLRYNYRRMIKNRATCFKRNGLLGSGAFAERYDCLAPAVPPSRGRSSTGLVSTDNAVSKSYNGFAAGVFADCPDYLAGINFPAPLTDPTGGVFGRTDLAQVLLEALTWMTDDIVNRLYAGPAHCGDGTIQADIGEECDDGNRTSCDGCDYNCTLPTCGNAVGCAGSEECDDGDDESGDGCSPTCDLEYCGDGTIQEGLGEVCDDGNNSLGDGCTPNCEFGGF
ncbi:MAG TPA: DUF4215 domain-containing protein [Candidatus Limnocylindrales bacterium]|nr:DUF4215 domain-containing protein [Candidatus Limnocylindrales bacterium]